jgi:hypothetical protein
MGPVRRYFLDRWNGAVPIGTLFWRDAVLVATGINVAATLAALALFAAGVSNVVAMAVFLTPLPYTLFLAFAVWRSAERLASPARQLYQLGAVAWLIGALVI